MKIILLKKIYSFILLICGFFFLTHSDLMAQCGPCSGNNKVRITKITYSCPYGCEICQTKCIQEDLLQKYYEQGWILGSGCRGHGCGGNQVINQLHTEALPLTVSIDPSSNSSIISFSLSQSGKVSLKVFDITEKLIATIADATFKEGEHEITWNTKGLTAGIYFLHAQSSESVQTAKMVVSN